MNRVSERHKVRLGTVEAAPAEDPARLDHDDLAVRPQEVRAHWVPEQSVERGLRAVVRPHAHPPRDAWTSAQCGPRAAAGTDGALTREADGAGTRSPAGPGSE